MSYKCRYTTSQHNCIIELSQEEYEEIMEIREQIQKNKAQVSELLKLYEKLEPSRVYKTPKDINFTNL